MNFPEWSKWVVLFLAWLSIILTAHYAVFPSLRDIAKKEEENEKIRRFLLKRAEEED